MRHQLLPLVLMFLSTDESCSKRENKIHYLMLAHVKYLWAVLTVVGFALVGCGGSDSTTATTTTTPPATPQTEAQKVTAAINGCGTLACVTTELAKIDGNADINGEERSAIETAAATKRTELQRALGRTPLEDDALTAANELADGIAGSEALELDSTHISTSNAELADNEPWKKGSGNSIKGWTARSYNIPNPEGSSGLTQDIRVWQENPVYLSQKYEDFFGEDGNGASSISNAATVTNLAPTLNLVDPLATAFNKSALPSDFRTRAWKRILNDDGTATASWELTGNFFDVLGKFVCDATNCSALSGQLDAANALPKVTNSINAINANAAAENTLTAFTTITGLTFVPQSASVDEVDVDAKWAKLQNPNFLNFGMYWTTEVTDSGAVNSISVDPFAGGGKEFVDIANIVQTGEGILTASYTGGAAGIYVRTVTDENDDDIPTGYGGFTADANFTAKFGTSSDTLYGKIDNFAVVNGEGAGAAPGDWTVSIGSSDKPLSIGDASGSVTNSDGSFHAQFQGEPSTKRQSNGHGYAPYGLVGTFQDSFDDGHATGAFGTECRGSNCVKQN